MSTPPNSSSDQGQPTKGSRNRTRLIIVGTFVAMLVVAFGYMLLVGGLVD